MTIALRHVLGWFSEMRTVAVIALCAAMTGCGYDGDGDLTVDGTWPLRSYELTLPQVSLEPGSHRFRVSGLPHIPGRGPRVYLRVVGNEPLVCTRLSTKLTLRLTTARGRVLLTKTGPLNRLAARVWAEGRNDASGDEEQALGKR